MNKDSFKRYVGLLQKKESRKYLLIGGGILLVLTIVVAAIIISFNAQLHAARTDFSTQLETAMKYREKQVNRLQAGISQDNIRRWNIISAEKVIVSVNKKLPHETSNFYATVVVDECERHNLDPSLILSIITQESRFRANSVSLKDAHGLMQVIDETGRWIAKEIGVVYNDTLRLDPKMSIKMGTWYMSYLLDLYDGSETKALAHYNGGPYQKNAYTYRLAYKNTPDYARSKKEVKTEVMTFRARKDADEELTSEEEARHKFIEKIYAAQNLHPETAAYVPEILKRRNKFKEMMLDPSSVKVEIDSTGTE